MATQLATYSAPALAKGLDILELLASRAEPLSLRRIADELGRSKSELFRMVTVLVERGYIERNPVTDDLVLTDRLFSLGLRTPRTRSLVEEAVPVMSGLADATGLSVHLVVLYRGQTVVVASVSGAHDVSFTLKLGFSRPAVDATSGQVILAFQPVEDRDRGIRESMPLVKRPMTAAKVRRELERIRRQGFEIHESRDFVGLADICCPILDLGGNAIASMIASSLKRYGQEHRLLDVLEPLKQACSRVGGAIT